MKLYYVILYTVTGSNYAALLVLDTSIFRHLTTFSLLMLCHLYRILSYSPAYYPFVENHMASKGLQFYQIFIKWLFFCSGTIPKFIPVDHHSLLSTYFFFKLLDNICIFCFILTCFPSKIIKSGKNPGDPWQTRSWLF